jgi:hypothetical protein
MESGEQEWSAESRYDVWNLEITFGEWIWSPEAKFPE